MYKIRDEVWVVFVGLLQWDENNGECFQGFFTAEDNEFLNMQILTAERLEQLGDFDNDLYGWVASVLDEVLEFIKETGLNNINSMLKEKDKRDIIDTAVVRIEEGAPYPTNPFQANINALNHLFDIKI